MHFLPSGKEGSASLGKAVVGTGVLSVVHHLASLVSLDERPSVCPVLALMFLPLIHTLPKDRSKRTALGSCKLEWLNFQTLF